MPDDAPFRIKIDSHPVSIGERQTSAPEPTGRMLRRWLDVLEDYRETGELVVTIAEDTELPGELRSERLRPEAWHTWRSKQTARQLLQDIEFVDPQRWSEAPDDRAAWVEVGQLRLYPAFQFEANTGHLRDEVLDTLDTFARHKVRGWSVALWLAAPNGYLRQRPVDAFEARAPDVADAARRLFNPPW